MTDANGVSALLDRIHAIPGFSRPTWKPCTDTEITLLERHYAVILPATYKVFLKALGHGAGGFLSNDHWQWEFGFLMRNAQRETYTLEFEVPFTLPERYFVFASRLAGINLLFVADGQNDDPPVLCFGDETQHNPEPWYASFWDWIAEMVAYHEHFRG